MPRTQKSTALYPHPFSKGYWHDAAAELKNLKTLVIAALMIALRVATKGLAVPIAPGLRLFSVASFINMLGSMIIGPVVAIPAAVISDFLGVLIWEGLGTYFLPYVLQEIGSSFIWALLLYRQKPTTWRVMLGRLSICLIVNIVMGVSIDMLYQSFYYGQSTVALTLPRVFKNTFMFPIETVALTFFLGLLVPITNRMGLTYSGSDAKAGLSFGKKQIILLFVLFLVGVGSVFGYLTYYYQNTSLSASYSTEERIEHNHEMLDHVQAEDDAFDQGNYITIVDSAKKEFLGSEITYTVSIYSYEEMTEKQVTDAWKLSKSGPTKGDYKDLLTKVATAKIIVNKSSGEVISCEIAHLN